MRALAGLDGMEAEIHAPGLRIIYVSQPGCAVCEVLRPKVAAIAEAVPHTTMVTLDAGAHPEVASRLSILSAPVVLVYAEGRELLREGRFLREADFEAALRRFAGLLGS